MNFVVSHSAITMDDFIVMSWPEQVDYILNNLAGNENRYVIYKDFMSFMAEFGEECIEMDRLTGHKFAPVLFVVAMQRLSKGAVMHEAVDFREQLPSKFWKYSSAHDDFHIMTPDCLEFIYKGLPIAAQFEPTKDYAIKIAWGLFDHLDEKGCCHKGFSLYCNNPVEEGEKLYTTALEILNANVSSNDIFYRCSRPLRWRKHKKWLRGYLTKNELWHEFFNNIGISLKFKTLLQRSRIKKEIENA